MILRAVILMLASAMGGGFAALASPQGDAGNGSAERGFNAFVFDFAQADTGVSSGAVTGRPVLQHDQNQMWGRGQYLPSEHLNSEFANWQSYHLSQAPEGYRWVRVGRGAYRVNVENGYIAEAVFGLPGD